MKKQRFVERTVQYSVEDIMLNLVLEALQKYKASFQPDYKESPHRTKISVIHLIWEFSKIAKKYGDDDEAFSMQEVLSYISAYRFDDAEYSILRLRKSLASPVA